MKKIRVEKIDIDQFSKPENIEDIEVVIGDSSVLNISDVGDYINAVKSKPTDSSSANPEIIIPKEKLSAKEKIRPKISKEANSDEIKIPKNVKQAKKHKHDSESSEGDIEKKKKKIKKKKHKDENTDASVSSDITHKKKKKKKLKKSDE